MLIAPVYDHMKDMSYEQLDNWIRTDPRWKGALIGHALTASVKAYVLHKSSVEAVVLYLLDELDDVIIKKNVGLTKNDVFEAVSKDVDLAKVFMV